MNAVSTRIGDFVFKYLAVGWVCFVGSAQEFVKVLNWRGFLKPRASEFRGMGLGPMPVGVAIGSEATVTDSRPPGAVSLSWEVTSKVLGSRQKALI
jgi:hypothetical protein